MRFWREHGTILAIGFLIYFALRQTSGYSFPEEWGFVRRIITDASIVVFATLYYAVTMWFAYKVEGRENDNSNI